MTKESKSSSAKMPMLEIVITIGIFAIISVFIVELFLSANTIQTRARDKSKAVILAETIAETMKSAKDFKEAAKELNLIETTGKIKKHQNGNVQISEIDEGTKGEDCVTVYTGHYDKEWNSTNKEEDYSVILIPYEEQIQNQAIKKYEVYIYRLKGYASMIQETTSEEIYHLSFAGRG